MLYAKVEAQDREVNQAELNKTSDAKWYRRLKIIDLLSTPDRNGFFRHFDEPPRERSRGQKPLAEQIELGAPVHLPLQAL